MRPARVPEIGRVTKTILPNVFAAAALGGSCGFLAFHTTKRSGARLRSDSGARARLGALVGCCTVLGRPEDCPCVAIGMRILRVMVPKCLLNLSGTLKR